jgi:hypothetical protein
MRENPKSQAPNPKKSQKMQNGKAESAEYWNLVL